MKKIIGIVIATLLLSNIGLASIKEIEKKNSTIMRESNDLLNRENGRLMKKLSKKDS